MIGEKERFRYVNEKLDAIIKEGPKEDFARISKRLPTLLMNNGVLLTMAYLLRRARSSEAERLLLEVLLEWLDRINKPLIKVKAEDLSISERMDAFAEELLDKLLGMETKELALLLDELLRIAEPIKILVEARIGDVNEG